jgi:hypothetical protein
MQCVECDCPLAKENVPSPPWKERENLCYVCREMQAAVTKREWFRTVHNEWLEEQRRRWRAANGSSEDV